MTATFRGKAPAAAPSQPPAVRTELRLGDWRVVLVSVPESEPDAVAVRIESRARTQRFKDCSMLQVAQPGRFSAHQASYHADAAGRMIRETFTARVRIGELIGMTTSSWSSLALCGHHELLNGAAQTSLGSFVQQHKARQGSTVAPVLATPPASDQPPAVAIVDVNLALSAGAIRVHRRPSTHPRQAFVMFAGVRLQDPGCGQLEIAVDADTSSVPLQQRPGIDRVPFASLETEFMSRFAASSSAGLRICGRSYELSPPDRAALTALARDLAPDAGSEAAR